jgi:ammonium transporter, Amt family
MFDTGNTAFMLMASSFVLLMTPGLAFFYGGLVGRKNVMTIMMQSFVSMGVTAVLWWAYGYSLCFSGGEGGFIGNLDKCFFQGVTMTSLCPVGSGRIPEFVFIAFQMMTAIITPALITGAFSNRMRFGSYLVFLVGWLTFVYFPFAHMVWGGGILQQMGVLDFGGGIVVHNLAGMAALAAVFFIGRRKHEDTPHNLPLMAIGMGLLWFGWFGFNCGNEFAVDGVTAIAFLNTQLSGAFGAMAWMILSWIFESKPKVLGFLTGGLAGLVVSTPCAGYVTPGSAVVIGLLGGIVCYSAVHFKNRMKWDDALDVWGVHGIGGLLGILLLGLLADKSINAEGANGFLNGNAGFFTTELVAVVVASVYAFALTYGMLWVINKFARVRTSREDEMFGVDDALHGEAAYEPAPLPPDFKPSKKTLNPAV